MEPEGGGLTSGMIGKGGVWEVDQKIANTYIFLKRAWNLAKIVL